jgi:uncharacterized protein (DUF305 family)
MPYRNLTLPAALAASLAVSCGPSAARAQTAAPDGTTEAAFMAENDAAMSMMMSGMSIKPTGDVDRDFATMMIAHHQGAIDMAQAELRHGTNEQLRRIAQEIVVDQIQEIAAMRLAVGDVLPPSFAAPTVMTVPAPMMHDAGEMTSSVTAK